MVLQAEHNFLITGDHDEVNRQHYVSRLRMHILNHIGGGMRKAFEQENKKETSKPETGETNLREKILNSNYGKFWSTMMVSCQDMVWESVIPPIERAQPKLNREISCQKNTLSKLFLNPDLKIPNYLTAVDIHRMPGSYHTERSNNDASQGALYDRGRFIYNAGQAGPFADGISRTMAEYISLKWPSFNPKKILELGCTIGTSTVPFVNKFKKSQVHAIDISAPVLRYGQARAEALGKRIYFHQMNAEKLDFDNGEFDLIFSCIMFHETSRKALPKILKECHRVLSPKGLMIHAELMPNNNLKDFDRFYMNWDAFYNNEPFYKTYTSLDPRELVLNAGFNEGSFFEVAIPDIDKSSAIEFNKVVSKSSVMSKNTGRVGEGVKWYTFGAWK